MLLENRMALVEPVGMHDRLLSYDSLCKALSHEARTVTLRRDAGIIWRRLEQNKNAQ